MQKKVSPSRNAATTEQGNAQKENPAAVLVCMHQNGLTKKKNRYATLM
jgi:hypothetical protein